MFENMKETQKNNTKKMDALMLTENPIARKNYASLKIYIDQFRKDDEAIVYTEEGLLDLSIERTSEMMSCTTLPEYVVTLSGYVDLDHYYEPMIRVIMDPEKEIAVPIFYLNDIMLCRMDYTDTFNRRGIKTLQHMLENMLDSISERLRGVIEPSKHIKGNSIPGILAGYEQYENTKENETYRIRMTYNSDSEEATYFRRSFRELFGKKLKSGDNHILTEDQLIQLVGLIISIGRGSDLKVNIFDYSKGCSVDPIMYMKPGDMRFFIAVATAGRMLSHDDESIVLSY